LGVIYEKKGITILQLLTQMRFFIATALNGEEIAFLGGKGRREIYHVGDQAVYFIWIDGDNLMGAIGKEEIAPGAKGHIFVVAADMFCHKLQGAGPEDAVDFIGAGLRSRHM
jgi:hypothetical protein